ncbi:MAG TPA: CHRD domain-containing protein [Lysobacter sp.]|nr:CHRD domain-containing protein [Lysobacter sp.]
MKRIALLALAACLPLVPANANDHEFTGILAGVKEVPAVSTVARGEFRAYVSGNTVHYLLRYANLEGAVTQAHIHLGQPAVAGGVIVWLCSNMPSPPTPPGVPPCPAPPARVTGIITAGDVVGPTAQGIDPGEFAELVRALRNGVTYANVHTDRFPTGELRSKIHPPGDRD